MLALNFGQEMAVSEGVNWKSIAGT
jgi:hypothetical protein